MVGNGGSVTSQIGRCDHGTVMMCHVNLPWSLVGGGRGGYRMFPRGGRPVMDWCLNAIEWCILNGAALCQGCQTDWGPVARLRPNGSRQTDLGLSDRLEPRKFTGSRSDPLAHSTPTGVPKTDWGHVDTLGAAKLTRASQTDWRELRRCIGSHADRLGPCAPTGAPQTNWGP